MVKRGVLSSEEGCGVVKRDVGGGVQDVGIHSLKTW